MERSPKKPDSTNRCDFAATDSEGAETHMRTFHPKAACIFVTFGLAMSLTLHAQTFTTLVSFSGRNGSSPDAALIEGSDGNFYGTTDVGGVACAPYGCGTIFQVTADGTLTDIYFFKGADGKVPMAKLVQGSDGNFYGTTSEGGHHFNCGGSGCGTVFKVTPQGSLTMLHSFCGDCGDGNDPRGLVQVDDNTFLGTTCSIASPDSGGVFKITSGGKFTILHTFCSETGCTDGNCAYGVLTPSGDGGFYGTTAYGGASGWGTIFKITSDGTLTTVHSFNFTDGGLPFAGLIRASDGNFYGTASAGGGGTLGGGEVFKMTPAGVFSTLYVFCLQAGCSDGESPGALVEGSDGNLYGTTASGGIYGAYGTIFRITLDGVLTTLHSFNGTDDGAGPSALIESHAGIFYGTTYGYANLGGKGTVFSLDAGLALPSGR